MFDGVCFQIRFADAEGGCPAGKCPVWVVWMKGWVFVYRCRMSRNNSPMTNNPIRGCDWVCGYSFLSSLILVFGGRALPGGFQPPGIAGDQWSPLRGGLHPPARRDCNRRGLRATNGRPYAAVFIRPPGGFQPPGITGDQWSPLRGHLPRRRNGRPYAANFHAVAMVAPTRPSSASSQWSPLRGHLLRRGGQCPPGYQKTNTSSL